jgi:hypothetical protein
MGTKKFDNALKSLVKFGQTKRAPFPEPLWCGGLTTLMFFGLPREHLPINTRALVRPAILFASLIGSRKNRHGTRMGGGGAGGEHDCAR